ncbi:MAG: hypothetical protein LBB63_01620 [Holosporaceae bacterium]|jgi:hypothetical protein|nr:hypothetical protein [Holosporaceae bacterium]
MKKAIKGLSLAMGIASMTANVGAMYDDNTKTETNSKMDTSVVVMSSEEINEEIERLECNVPNGLLGMERDISLKLDDPDVREMCCVEPKFPFADLGLGYKRYELCRAFVNNDDAFFHNPVLWKQGLDAVLNNPAMKDLEVNDFISRNSSGTCLLSVCLRHLYNGQVYEENFAGRLLPRISGNHNDLKKLDDAINDEGDTLWTYWASYLSQEGTSKEWVEFFRFIKIYDNYCDFNHKNNAGANIFTIARNSKNFDVELWPYQNCHLAWDFLADHGMSDLYKLSKLYR